MQELLNKIVFYTGGKMQKTHYTENGFTLAEVLITLGIIGIVAAMTLPTLIQKNKRAELQSGLKTGYSLLQQALQRMNADNGCPIIPANYPYRTLKNEFIKYFDNPIDCQWGGDQGTKESILCGKGVISEGSGQVMKGIYKTYNLSKNEISSVPLDDGQFALKNGMLVMIENHHNGTIFISIDINGINKKPNIWGHDLFTFQLMSDGKLLPMGAEKTAYNENTHCSKTATHNLNGIACTKRALTDSSYWKGI